MWTAKDKFGKIVRSKMSDQELKKFISKNKGYTFENKVDDEFKLLSILIVLSVIALIIIWL